MNLIINNPFTRLKKILDVKDMRSLYGIFFILLLSGIFEIAGIASIIPFINIISDPQYTVNNEYVMLIVNYYELDLRESKVFIGVSVLFLFIFINLFNIFSLHRTLYFIARIDSKVSRTVLKHYLKRPYGAFVESSPASLTKHILDDASMLGAGIIYPLIQIISKSIIILSISILLIIIDYKVFIGSFFILTIIYIIIYKKFTYIAKEAGEERLILNDQRYKITRDVFNSLKEVKFYSLEEYYQEAGRSGRDGKPSKAALFFNRNDIQNLNSLLKYRFPKRKIIQNVYQSIANNGQIAIGSGENEGVPIDITKFAQKIELHPLSIHYAIKTLENSGYIFVSDDITSGSKLKILQDRKEIEGILLNNGFQSRLLSIILRSYTGIFSNYVKISEGEIAEILKTSVDQVKKGLDIFERTHVLAYQKQVFLPRIFFSTNRVSAKNLIIPKEILELRYEVAKNQLDSIIKYAIEDKKCRTNIALFYFDELPKRKCNNCDCCQKDSTKLNHEKYIVQLIESNPVELAQLVNLSKLPRATTISEIRRLMDKNKIIREGNVLRIKT